MSNDYFAIESCIHDVCDKVKNIDIHIKYMLLRTRRMFKYSGLPESIPEKMLELYLQCYGHVAITKVNDELYALKGGFGGVPDAYYIPTQYVVSNPFLNYSQTLNINEDCVIMLNDSLHVGLLPMFKKYASELTENEISMKLVTINTRITSLLSADDDRTLASARQFIADMVDGKISIVGENAFLDGIKSQPYSTTGTINAIKDLIEQEQYLRATWFNEIGLQSNFNMKREAVNSAESALNEDILFPLVNDMLETRREAIEKVNAMFGTSISVELNSSWSDNMEELEADLEQMQNESDSDGSEVENDENKETE